MFVKLSKIALLAAGLLAAACSAPPAPFIVVNDPAEARRELVDLQQRIPNLIVRMPYATPFNFLQKKLYPPGARAWLRRDAAERLARVQSRLRDHGLQLVVWDAFRPPAIQREMWEEVPDERYVSNPARGGRHTRGTSVDVTIADFSSREIAMPTRFDDFTENATPGAPGIPDPAARNADLLAKFMIDAGFTRLASEWWHFDLQGYESCPLFDVTFESLAPF